MSLVLTQGIGLTKDELLNNIREAQFTQTRCTIVLHELVIEGEMLETKYDAVGTRPGLLYLARFDDPFTTEVLHMEDVFCPEPKDGILRWITRSW